MSKGEAMILFIVALSIGYFLGRLTTVDKNAMDFRQRVEYIPSSTVIHDTIVKERLVPYETFLTDTVLRYLTQEVDTASIIRDYYLSRRYSLDFSNDTIGVFKVDAEVNQNKLVYASSYIRPIVKTVTLEKTLHDKPTIQFYGMIGTSLDFETNKMSLGVDLKQRYLIGATAVRMNDRFGYTIDFGVKF